MDLKIIGVWLPILLLSVHLKITTAEPERETDTKQDEIPTTRPLEDQAVSEMNASTSTSIEGTQATNTVRDEVQSTTSSRTDATSVWRVEVMQVRNFKRVPNRCLCSNLI